MTRETENRIEFITFLIQEFAAAFKIPGPEAYLYLKKYGGLDFLFKHWWALHTDTPFWSLNSLYDVCRANGGYLR